MPTVPKGNKKAMSSFITAPEIAEICAISVSKAYQIVRELNEQMRKQGKLTLRGKVNRRFFRAAVSRGIKKRRGREPATLGLLYKPSPRLV